MMTDKQFRALMELLMCSDPWPISGNYGITAHDTLTDLADDEAHARNFDDWIVAYHEMDKS